jgi:hypothetical protein
MNKHPGLSVSVTLLVIILAAIAACVPEHVKKPETKAQVEGFKDIPWGTYIEQLQSEMIFGGRDTGRQLEWYTKKDEDLTLGKARLESISYIFLEGRFNRVSIVAKGSQNYAVLRDHLLATYGPTPQASENAYTWLLTETAVMLAYNPSTAIALLIFSGK